MTVYIVAQISIHDEERYGRYMAGFMPILVNHGGRLLAADEEPEPLQGEWGRDKFVLMRFPDREAAQTWMNSAEYQEISKDRLTATTGTVLMVHGFEPRAAVAE